MMTAGTIRAVFTWKMSRVYVSLEQSPLDLFPGVLAALICVHAKEDAQAARQAAGLLLQEVGLRLPFETLNTHTHTHRYFESFNHDW